MSDTPLPTPFIGKFGRIVDSVSGYIKHHETLLIVAAAALLLWFGSGKILDWKTQHDEKVYNAKNVALQAAADNSAAQAKANAELAAAYKDIADKTQAANAQLSSANAQLSDSLRNQKSKDATLAPPELASRIETLASLPPASVVPQPGDTFQLTQPAAVVIAQELENVPVLTQQLANTEQQRDNLNTQLTAQTGVVDGLHKEIDGLHTQIDAGNVAHQAEIKVIKDQAAKSKRKWFIIGYVAGLATRPVAKLFLGAN